MKKYLLSLIAFALFVISCGDDDAQLVNDLTFDFEFVTPEGTLNFGEAFELNGSTVQFETANFYFHGLQMSNAESGVFFSAEEAHILAGTNLTNSFNGVNLTPTNLSSTRVIIGVNQEQNNQIEADFTQRTAEDPLSIQDPSMHWNWNSGYKFVRFDGEVDTDGDGLVDTPIAYHLGTDALRAEVEIASNKALSAGVTNVTMAFNLAEFFSGVDFQIESNWDTHTGNNLPLAQQLTENLQSSLSIN